MDVLKHPVVEPNQAIVRGLTYIQPYEIDIFHSVRSKFDGQLLVSVLNSLYPGDVHHWEKEVIAGRVRVLPRSTVGHRAYYKQASINHAVSTNERVCFRIHSHEFVYPCNPLRVLSEWKEMLPGKHGPWLFHIIAVDKPGGLPCLGGLDQRYNNALALYERHLGRKLFPVHRLDKLVSGLWLLAASKASCVFFFELMQRRSVKKVYIARVKGRLKQPDLLVTLPLRFCGKSRKSVVDTSEGKPCHTSVSLLHYLPADDTSVVQVEIITGRRHQIRAHLAAVGHPIANDALYCCPMGGACTLSKSVGIPLAAVYDGTVEGERKGAAVALDATEQQDTKREVSETISVESGDNICKSCPHCFAKPYPTPIYSDDSNGTIQLMNVGAKGWCPKCHWVTDVLSGNAVAPQVPSAIWLHSLHYETSFGEGLKFEADSSTPHFAIK
jgi:23S rRNA-/tRNA-specific pseudouridylate synthase